MGRDGRARAGARGRPRPDARQRDLRARTAPLPDGHEPHGAQSGQHHDVGGTAAVGPVDEVLRRGRLARERPRRARRGRSALRARQLLAEVVLGQRTLRCVRVVPS